MNSSLLIEKPMLDGSSGNESYEMIYFRENLERISDEEFLDLKYLKLGVVIYQISLTNQRMI
jgi:hypothetical protein